MFGQLDYDYNEDPRLEPPAEPAPPLLLVIAVVLALGLFIACL